MNEKRLYRSARDKKLLGVCGGIAEYFEIDPTVVRLIWAIGTFFSVGLGLLLYFIAALIIPVNNNY